MSPLQTILSSSHFFYQLFMVLIVSSLVSPKRCRHESINRIFSVMSKEILMSYQLVKPVPSNLSNFTKFWFIIRTQQYSLLLPQLNTLRLLGIVEERNKIVITRLFWGVKIISLRCLLPLFPQSLKGLMQYTLRIQKTKSKITNNKFAASAVNEVSQYINWTTCLYKFFSD